jgi:hypothetical protein
MVAVTVDVAATVEVVATVAVAVAFTVVGQDDIGVDLDADTGYRHVQALGRRL